MIGTQKAEEQAVITNQPQVVASYSKPVPAVASYAQPVPTEPVQKSQLWDLANTVCMFFDNVSSFTYMQY